MKSIKLRTMEPLTAEAEEEERVGWCAPGNALDLELTSQKVFREGYLTLGLRLDKWSIPRGLFNAHFDVAKAEHIARTGREKLTKREKEDLKFRINKKLKRKLIPVTRHTDVCWMMERGIVLLWNRSARTKEDFQTLFELTFGVRLQEASPYVVARELRAGEVAPFNGLEQTSLGRGPQEVTA